MWWGQAATTLCAQRQRRRSNRHQPGRAGGNDGIYARHFGIGALSVTAYGEVVGTARVGITAIADNANSTTFSVTTWDKVTGGLAGILAHHGGLGALTIVAHDDVTSTLNRGIDALISNTSDTGLLSITAEDVTGLDRGITAINRGLGALSIVANGDVEGTGSYGIYAKNYGVDLISGNSLSITSEGVTGGTYGIHARNDGTGALTIVADGDVEGSSSVGIFALNFNSAGTGPLTITTEGVTGGVHGIFALNNGRGALTVTANGDVVGASDTGIYAHQLNATTTGPLSIVTYGMVTGGYTVS